jgi:SPP1 gp7 family putative phage head morphogenesis protein
MENVNIPFLAKTPSSIELSKLPVSKAVDKLEDDLSAYLVNFANTIEKTPQTHTSVLSMANDLDSTLRLYSQQIYWIGVAYVCAFDEVKPLLTSRDLENIKNISDNISKSIWRRIDKFFVREKLLEDESQAEELSKILKQESKPRSLKTVFNPKLHEPLNLDKQLKGVATILATTALNVATIDKSRQISEGIAKGQIINPEHVNLDKIASGSLNFSSILRKFANQVKNVEKRIQIGLGLKHEMVWITREDEKVCPICMALEGERWFAEDPDRPVPIRDTHFGCRCRMLLVDSSRGAAASIFAA